MSYNCYNLRYLFCTRRRNCQGSHLLTPIPGPGPLISLPTPTLSCPAHMQGDTLATYLSSIHTPWLAVCFRSVPVGGVLCLLRAVLGEDACEALLVSSESLGIFSRLPETPLNSSSQNPSLPTFSYLLLRCPGMDLNYMDQLLLLLLCSWHHLLASPTAQGFSSFSSLHPTLHIYNFHSPMLLILLYHKLGYANFQRVHYCDYMLFTGEPCNIFH